MVATTTPTTQQKSTLNPILKSDQKSVKRNGPRVKRVCRSAQYFNVCIDYYWNNN
jgi:hypothetical protein